MTTAIADTDPQLNALLDWIAGSTGHRCLTVTMPGDSALALVGLLQLATRHPDVSETMTSIAREFVSSVMDQVPESIREIMEAGWSDAEDER